LSQSDPLTPLLKTVGSSPLAAIRRLRSVSDVVGRLGHPPATAARQWNGTLR